MNERLNSYFKEHPEKREAIDVLVRRSLTMQKERDERWKKREEYLKQWLTPTQVTE